LATANTLNLIWHYTTGENFIQIVEVGFLDPNKTVTLPGERPILWFSSEPFWEPTANKALSLDGAVKTLSMDETREHGGGLVRFGVRASVLIRWPKLGRKAGMPPQTVRSLELVGIKQGAKPSNWYGSLKRIKVRECAAIQVMDENSEWADVTPKK
jgi:hypothetical protein